MAVEKFIWIVRWGDFQHYAPERDRPPAWIKTYTKQLDDDRYTNLSPRRRALLHDLRTAFARTSGQLSDNTRTLSRRLLTQVRDDDLQALNRAGLIEVISRTTLDRRLDKLYASRAPARSKEAEAEEELPKGSSSTTPTPANPEANGLPDITSECKAILDYCKDADSRSLKTLLAAANGLPLGSLVKVRESCRFNRGKIGVGYAVNALKSEKHEREVAA